MYSNAIFYLDYELGVDTARTDLVPSAYANNGAGLVRVTVGVFDTSKYVTDAVVDIVGTTSAVYDGAWKITVIDNTHIDLQGSTYSSNPAAKGTCIPRGGANWADAWKTLTTGATATRLAAGDIVKVAKSPAPVSLGTTGVWTNLSKTITLGATKNLNIDMCEADWTAIHAVSAAKLAVATDAKEGSYCEKIVEDATGAVNEVQAYYPTGTLDLSPYQKISFWIKNEAVIADAVTWVINLYTTTDASGAPADSFIIPAIPSTGRWIPLTLTKVGGGNLTNGIKSIALVNGATTVPTASKYIYLDDIIACTTSGLNLQSLISKNSAEQGGAEGWYGIQSINGTTVLLDNGTATKANAGRGYSGTTETVTTYIRETIKTAMASGQTSPVQQFMKSGLITSPVQYQAGYDTSTGNQTGETFFDGLNGLGYGLYLYGLDYDTINYFNVVRYYNGIQSDSSDYINITNFDNANNCSSGGIYISSSGGGGFSWGTIRNANNNDYFGLYLMMYNYPVTLISNANNNLGYGLYISGTLNVFSEITNAKNNLYYGIYFNNCSLNYVNKGSTANNGSNGVGSLGDNYLKDFTISETTPFMTVTGSNSRVYCKNYGGVANDDRQYGTGFIIYKQTTTRHTASGYAWELSLVSSMASTRLSAFPVNLKIARIACVADKLVTVKAWIKKDHATNVGAKLVCRGLQIAGVDSDVVVTKANDTDWEELTITFTPTEAGVVEIEVWEYYIANSSNVYVDDLTITQAD